MIKRLLLFVATAVVACTKVDEGTFDVSSENIRAVIVNEGQFGAGTGSISALYNDNTYQNDLFRSVNSRPIGDVPQSIKRIGQNYYIPVNNSNKVEVIDATTFCSVETMVLTHTTIPMYVEYLGGDSIVVSDQTGYDGGAQGSLMIMDIRHGESRDVLQRLVQMDSPTFQMRLLDGKLFVVGAQLSVFDADNLEAGADRKIDVDLVDFTNICLDSSGLLWMFATNGVVCVDPVTEAVVCEIEMSDVDNLWGNIDIDSAGRWLYFNIDNLIYAIDTLDPKVPTEPIITHDNGDSTWTTYSLGVSKEDTILVARVEYGSTTRGRVFEYNIDGSYASTFIVDGVEQPYFLTGIFPSGILFL